VKSQPGVAQSPRFIVSHTKVVASKELQGKKKPILLKFTTSPSLEMVTLSVKVALVKECKPEIILLL
jgi:hypothetical protein